MIYHHIFNLNCIFVSIFVYYIIINCHQLYDAYINFFKKKKQYMNYLLIIYIYFVEFFLIFQFNFFSLYVSIPYILINIFNNLKKIIYKLKNI